jgi:hypothetical protein
MSANGEGLAPDSPQLNPEPVVDISRMNIFSTDTDLFSFAGT